MVNPIAERVLRKLENRYLAQTGDLPVIQNTHVDNVIDELRCRLNEKQTGMSLAGVDRPCYNRGSNSRIEAGYVR